MKKMELWGLFFGLLLMTGLNAAEVTQFGAKITKKVMGPTDSPVLTLPDGWRILDGEKYTGINDREYYFTIEKEGKKLDPPTVQADWPNVEIVDVYGAADFERTDTGCRFQMRDSRAPTHFGTSLPRLGAVQVYVFHNVEGLQAGPHRNKPYPKNEIAAQLNFMFASREMMREAGFTQSADSIDATINLYGFETNYPNGHNDYPPHFHIMTIWDGWKFIHCTHFILSPAGKVLYNNQYVVENGKDNLDLCKDYKPGTEVGLPDRSGEVKMTFSVLVDGSGVLMKIPGSETEYRVSSGNPADFVNFSTRPNSSAPWEVKTVTRVTDDSINGILTVETTRNDQTDTPQPEKEEWHYNPNTGDLIE